MLNSDKSSAYQDLSVQAQNVSLTQHWRFGYVGLTFSPRCCQACDNPGDSCPPRTKRSSSAASPAKLSPATCHSPASSAPAPPSQRSTSSISPAESFPSFSM